MVKAELSYNPYLQETDIKFNGQPPRINSHVEKYLDKKLQVWIKKLPRIFRDEMANTNLHNIPILYVIDDLGENAASVAGSAAGAALAGAALCSVVPGAGTAAGFLIGGGASLVGGMVGTALATGAYKSAVEVGSAGAEVLADKAHEMASGTLEVAKDCMPEHVDDVRNALNTFLAENEMPFSV